MDKINNLVYYTNGYKLVYLPDHNKAIKEGCWAGFVYEHVKVAEEDLGRELQADEVVHHLDGNRSNNRSGNLLVLTNKTHAKLHIWINSGCPGADSLKKNGFIGKEVFSPPQSCEVCSITLQLDQLKYCSTSCFNLASNRVERPSKEVLTEKVKTCKSMEALGSEYGLSSNAIRKWMKSYGIPHRNILLGRAAPQAAL